MLSYQHFTDDCGLDFNNGEVDTFSIWKTLDFFATNSSICDTSGSILFYTNGIWIANRNNDSLQNSAGFNPGWATDHYASEGIGYDGSKFCYVNQNYNFDFMEFDRCTGEFFNPIHIVLPDSNLSQGISFSPNGRFIYCNTYTQLFQFDTWANNLLQSMILIDTIPFTQPGIADWFAAQMLAPDNKIYLSTYNGVDAMHVINNPDSLGIACDFERKRLILPTYNGYSIPNHPNYDLGSLQGSACDTLNSSTTNFNITNVSFRIQPNPINHWRYCSADFNQ